MVVFKFIIVDLCVKGILVNIFGGIMKCDVIVEGVLVVVQEVGLEVFLVVCLAGINVEFGKKILVESGLVVIVVDNMQDVVEKIVVVVWEV